MATRRTAILLAILVVTACIHPAQAQVFSDGFESNDFSAWTGTSGSPSVTSNMPHCGSYNFEATPGSTNTYCYKSITATGHIYMRTYFRFTDTLSSGGYYYIMFFSSSGQFMVRALLYNDGGTVKWGMRYRSASGAPYTYSTQQTNPSTDTWYCVEVEMLCSTADGNLDGEYHLYIDDAELTDIAQTSIDTDYTTVNSVQCEAYESSSTSPTFYHDCVVVDTSYIGPEAEEGQDLTFINASSLLLHDSATAGLDLARTYGDVLALYASDTMNKEAGFQATGTLALWAAAAIGREWGFTLSGLIHLWESHSMTTELAAGVERFFTLLATLRLHAAALPTFEVRTPVEHAFNLYAAIHLHDSLAVAKELGYMATATIRLWDSAAMTTQGVAQDLTFILTETLHLIASVAATMETAALVLDAASIAGLALIIAVVAVALVMVRRRND